MSVRPLLPMFLLVTNGPFELSFGGVVFFDPTVFYFYTKILHRVIRNSHCFYHSRFTSSTPVFVFLIFCPLIFSSVKMLYFLFLQAQKTS